VNLTPGDMYKVTTMIPGVQRYAREHVMKFLGMEGHEYSFSARPVAGTQQFPSSHVLNIQWVRSDTLPYMNRRA
jgi:hypothetical protein